MFEVALNLVEEQIIDLEKKRIKGSCLFVCLLSNLASLLPKHAVFLIQWGSKTASFIKLSYPNIKAHPKAPQQG